MLLPKESIPSGELYQCHELGAILEKPVKGVVQTKVIHYQQKYSAPSLRRLNLRICAQFMRLEQAQVVMTHNKRVALIKHSVVI